MARLALIGLAFLLLEVDPAAAQPTDVSARQVRASVRPPVRLRVTPYRRVARDCAVRYVQEYRPSGPVIVPRMTCWWVRS